MNALAEYIDLIVEPTFEDFRKNPGSARHGFLACVAAFHSVDRAAQLMSKKSATVRQKWRSKSFEFTAIDMITHHFKHTHSSLDEPNSHHDGIPLSFVLGLGKKPDQLETRNLVFLVRDVLKFFAATGNGRRLAIFQNRRYALFDCTGAQSAAFRASG